MQNAISTESDILRLEALQTQFKAKMTEYQAEYATYISLANSPTSSSTFITLPKMTYTGATLISNNRNMTPQLCETLCRANNSCTAATFNSLSKICNLYRGESGKIANGKDSDSLIIREVSRQLVILRNINKQLIAITNEMIAVSRNINAPLSRNINTESINDVYLIRNHNKLKEEQDKIKGLLDVFNNLDREYDDEVLKTEKSYSRYYLWLTALIIMLILVGKFVLFPGSGGNVISVILSTIFIVSTILLTANLNSPVVYSIWTFLLVIIIMVFLKLSPTN